VERSWLASSLTVGFVPEHWILGCRRAAVSCVLQLTSAFTFAPASRNAGAELEMQDPKSCVHGAVGPSLFWMTPKMSSTHGPHTVPLSRDLQLAGCLSKRESVDAQKFPARCKTHHLRRGQAGARRCGAVKAIEHSQCREKCLATHALAESANFVDGSLSFDLTWAVPRESPLGTFLLFFSRKLYLHWC
jgi:hypothetical protein